MHKRHCTHQWFADSFSEHINLECPNNSSSANIMRIGNHQNIPKRDGAASVIDWTLIRLFLWAEGESANQRSCTTTLYTSMVCRPVSRTAHFNSECPTIHHRRQYDPICKIRFRSRSQNYPKIPCASCINLPSACNFLHELTD
jgi:hypothetical protein